MKVLNDLGYHGFSDLRKILLDVGFEEVLTMLGCLFTSEAPLTCAFLRKPCITSKLEMQYPPMQKTEPVEPGSVYSVKVFDRKLDRREILYTECDEDFIDSLLSFLVFPLELACSFSDDNNILRCVGNLCRSPCRRASASNFYQIPDYFIYNHKFLVYYLRCMSGYECFVPRKSRGSRILARQINRSLTSGGGKIVKVFPNDPKEKFGTSSTCGTGFVKSNTLFIVSNDLIITPMNSSSTIGLLKKMQVDISDLEEHQINISRADVCL